MKPTRLDSPPLPPLVARAPGGAIVVARAGHSLVVLDLAGTTPVERFRFEPPEGVRAIAASQSGHVAWLDGDWALCLQGRDGARVVIATEIEQSALAAQARGMPALGWLAFDAINQLFLGEVTKESFARIRLFDTNLQELDRAGSAEAPLFSECGGEIHPASEWGEGVDVHVQSEGSAVALAVNVGDDAVTLAIASGEGGRLTVRGMSEADSALGGLHGERVLAVACLSATSLVLIDSDRFAVRVSWEDGAPVVGESVGGLFRDPLFKELCQRFDENDRAGIGINGPIAVRDDRLWAVIETPCEEGPDFAQAGVVEIDLATLRPMRFVESPDEGSDLEPLGCGLLAVSRREDETIRLFRLSSTE